MTKLGELATTIRSKNAGPFWTIIDIVLVDDDAFQMVMRSQVTSASRFASIYGAPAEDVIVTTIQTSSWRAQRTAPGAFRRRS